MGAFSMLNCLLRALQRRGGRRGATRDMWRLIIKLGEGGKRGKKEGR